VIIKKELTIMSELANPATPDLQQQLIHLKQDLHRLRRLSLCAILALLIGFLTLFYWNQNPGLSSNAPLETTGLILRDVRGEKRVEFKIDDTGQPSLHFFDQYNNDRIRLALDPNGRPRLAMTDGRMLRLWMAVNNEESPELFFHDQTSAKRAELRLDQTGSPALLMLDHEETPRAAFGVDEEMIPGVLLHGPKESRADLTILPNGVPLLGLSDINGNVVFRVP
jgi:hypothetical protein